MVSQSDQIRACVREMEAELENLRQVVSFREFIGYEMALNKVKNRFKNVIKK